MLRRGFLALAAGLVFAGLVFAGPASAAYPDKPIRLIVPFGSGESDVVARLVAQAMSTDLGQPILVENRAGAGGNIAASFVAHAPADGYTLLAGFSNIFVTNPTMYKNLPYDPEKNFAPISLAAESQFLLVVRNDLPAKNVKELIDYAKANPGKLSFSSGGVGSPLHLAGELFMSRTGTKLLHVPYTGGVDAARAVLNGEVDMIFGALSSSIGSVQAGQVRAIAATGSARYTVLPDVPTISESGVQGFTITAWHSIVAPASTPAPILERLRAAMKKSVESADVKTKLEGIGLTPVTSTGEELAARMKSERTLWTGVIKNAGIQPQ